MYRDDGTYEFLIYKILKNYNDLFLKKKINKIDNSFGQLGSIT